MESYLYSDSLGPRDIAEKVTGSTGLNPVSTEVGASTNVAFVFAVALTPDEKGRLDDWMTQRGYAFVEQKTVTAPDRTFEAFAGVSPDGSKFSLQVSDTGVVSGVKIS